MPSLSGRGPWLRVAAPVLPALLIFPALLLPVLAAAQSREELQEPEPPVRSDDRPKVFLDCQSDCFLDYVRTEVTFVDYVRDRTDTDLHILVTVQPTGAGGREYTLALMGQGRFASMNETLRYVSEQGAPEERVRRGLVQVLKLGLMRYVMQTGIAPHISISSSEPAQERKTKDPWKSWVFSTRAEGELEGEESRSEYWVRLSAGANRVTPEWKVNVGLSARHEEQRFDVVEDGGVSRVVSTRIDRDLSAMVVRSVGPRWSFGTAGGAWTNTFENTDRGLRLGPMAEFSVFPYEQSTRRRLVAQYKLELRSLRYDEETLFGLRRETRWRHGVEIEMDQRQPWGTISGELEFFHYLHDPGKYRLEGRGEASLRLAQGLSLNLGAGASRVRDRLSLPRRDATAEEILLRQRQLASGYEYGGWVGLTYTFGSIYNNTVNPRFN